MSKENRPTDDVGRDGAADDVHESLLSEVSRVVPSPTRLRITSPRAMAIQPMR